MVILTSPLALDLSNMRVSLDKNCARVENENELSHINFTTRTLSDSYLVVV